MRAREGLRLRHVGDRHLIVDARTPGDDNMDIYDLNDAAAHLWTMIEGADRTIGELAQALEQRYGIGHTQALADAEAQTKEWHRYGLLND